jgi:hypothetical protein
MDELVDFLLKPVPDHPDLFAFRYDFLLEGKSLRRGEKAPTVTEEENGDLIIEGWAASFEGSTARARTSCQARSSEASSPSWKARRRFASSIRRIMASVASSTSRRSPRASG